MNLAPAIEAAARAQWEVWSTGPAAGLFPGILPGTRWDHLPEWAREEVRKAVTPAVEAAAPHITRATLHDEALRADDHGLPLYTALARERMRNRAEEIQAVTA